MSVPGVNDRPTERVGSLEGHEGAVMAVRFNRKMVATVTANMSNLGDGGYCMTCGKDRLVRLWNPHTQLLIKTYQEHSFEVTDVDA